MIQMRSTSLLIYALLVAAAPVTCVGQFEVTTGSCGTAAGKSASACASPNYSDARNNASLGTISSAVGHASEYAGAKITGSGQTALYLTMPGNASATDPLQAANQDATRFTFKLPDLPNKSVWDANRHSILPPRSMFPAFKGKETGLFTPQGAFRELKPAEEFLPELLEKKGILERVGDSLIHGGRFAKVLGVVLLIAAGVIAAMSGNAVMVLVIGAILTTIAIIAMRRQPARTIAVSVLLILAVTAGAALAAHHHHPQDSFEQVTPFAQ